MWVFKLTINSGILGMFMHNVTGMFLRIISFLRQITMLSNHPPHDDNPNINYVVHGLKHFDESNMNMFEMAKDPQVMFDMFKTVLPKVARDLYTIPAVKELYDKRNQFDLMIIDQLFNEVRCMF